jgi:outer membrane protein assembly factor BamB
MTSELASPIHALGVVPIFVNAGAAVIPTVIASVASFVAILFKPRELAALFRRKPWLPVAVIVGGAVLWLAASRILSNPVSAAQNDRTPTKQKTDWTSFALKLIRDQEMAGKTTGIKPLWDYPASDGMVLTTPAVDPTTGKVFSGAAIQDVASYFGSLFCLDANGHELWKLDQVEGEDCKPFFSSPALTPDGKFLVIGQGLHDHTDCRLICVNTETGQPKWTAKTPLHIESSPAIDAKRDLVVVGCGAIEGPDHKPTSHPGYVLAVRLSDGRELWRHDVADPESSPAIAEDGIVYIGSGFNGNAVVALRSESEEQLKSKGLKRELWKTPAKYPITGPITLVNDLVIVGGGNGDFVYEAPNPAGVVVALDRKTGQPKWEIPTGAAVLGKVEHRNGKLYVPVRTGQVLCLNLSDGSQVWAQSISGKSPILAGPTISEDGQTLYAVSNDGYLALLRTSDGKILERHPLNHPNKPPPQQPMNVSTPTLHKDRLYVGSQTGGLHCFESIKSK